MCFTVEGSIQKKLSSSLRAEKDFDRNRENKARNKAMTNSRKIES